MSKLRQWIDALIDPNFELSEDRLPIPWIIWFAMLDDGSQHRQVIRAMSEQDAVATFHDNFFHIAYGDDIEHAYDPEAAQHYRIITVAPGGLYRYNRPGYWPMQIIASS